MPESYLVDYHGLIRDRHGRYVARRGVHLQRLRQDVGRLPQRGRVRPCVMGSEVGAPRPNSGTAVLSHVRPESFTAAPAD